MLITILQIFVVHFFGFFYQRIHYINLSARLQFLAHESIQGGQLVVVAMQGLNRFASRGQFINNRNFEVAVDRHGQRAWDGCGCHYQHMGRHGVFGPEFRTLNHTKTMLFVNNNQAQVGKLHRIFD